MIRFPLLFLISLYCIVAVSESRAQDIQTELITTLANTVEETSGLILVDGRIITHNDSGGEPALYEIDSSDGHVTRSVTVMNASNVDWEDICQDGEYIYIGDFGNNDGSRQNLVIYKVSIADYLSDLNKIPSETIHISYGDQDNFEPDLQRTPYDAETLISMNDSLYIFTKNHRGIQSYIYPAPKNPGNYILHKTDSINTGGLVTGGAYIKAFNSIILTGYNQLNPFIILIRNASGKSFTISSKVYMITENSRQVESIYPTAGNKFLITTEGNKLNHAALLRFTLRTITSELSENSLPFRAFPNPASDKVNVPFPESCGVELVTLSGQKAISGKAGIIDISPLTPGCYIIRVQNATGKLLMTDKLIVR